MAKKNFKQGIDVLLGDSTQDVDSNQSTKAIAGSGLEKEIKGKDTLTTLLVDPELMQKIKWIAYWERVKIKNVVNASFKAYITQYESTYGEIKMERNQKI